MFYRNFVPKEFLRYSTSKNGVTLKTGLGVRQGHWIACHHAIERIRLPIDVLYNCDFISCRFPSPVYFAPPPKELPLELDISAGSKRTGMMGLPDGRKCLKIGLTI